MRIGFIGVGLMGEPMAANVIRAGFEVHVWNRSNPSAARLEELGAIRESDPLHVISSCDATIVMLATEDAISTTLTPGSPRFRKAIAGRGLVHMGTTSAEFSAEIDAHVRESGGWYVEAPVSGSRVPAEQGRLVAMAAGDPGHLDEMEVVFAAMCAGVLRCGNPPSGTHMKFAVNIYLISIVTALAEAYHFAQAKQLDIDTFVTAINSGQMASPIAAVKLDKLGRADFSPQAAIADVYKNSRLIADAAHSARIATPLLNTCHELFLDALNCGMGGLDMIGVVKPIASRTVALRER